MTEAHSHDTRTRTATTTKKAINQPRNWVVTDATKPYTFKYLQYGKPVLIDIHQTPADDTWPGGALWDIGVILANVFVCLGGFFPTTPSAPLSTSKPSKSTTTTTTTTITSNNKNTLKPPSRLLEAFPTTKDLTVLELGCGVGLTSIVASAVLGTQLTIATDLDVVVDQVTRPNVERNSTIPSSSSTSSPTKKPVYRISTAGKRGRVMSMPLCWGNANDEDAVLECFRQWTKVPKVSSKQLKKPQPSKGKSSKGGTSSSSSSSSPQLLPRDPGQPDLIIIGDVAYQHRPGAPSHFDILVSTLLRFLGPHTTVVFGTRMRMPASSDLLDMFHQHMDEIVNPPISADEIDPNFGLFKHQITVHVFKKKPA